MIRIIHISDRPDVKFDPEETSVDCIEGLEATPWLSGWLNIPNFYSFAQGFNFLYVIMRDGTWSIVGEIIEGNPDWIPDVTSFKRVDMS